jgi:hypothetical protein
VKIVFDTKLRRPACVLLQAAYGAEPHIAENFDPETWLLAPTPDMAMFDVNPNQLKQLIIMLEKALCEKLPE